MTDRQAKPAALVAVAVGVLSLTLQASSCQPRRYQRDRYKGVQVPIGGTERDKLWLGLINLGTQPSATEVLCLEIQRSHGVSSAGVALKACLTDANETSLLARLTEGGTTFTQKACSATATADDFPLTQLFFGAPTDAIKKQALRDSFDRANTACATIPQSEPTTAVSTLR